MQLHTRAERFFMCTFFFFFFAAAMYMLQFNNKFFLGWKNFFITTRRNKEVPVFIQKMELPLFFSSYIHLWYENCFCLHVNTVFHSLTWFGLANHTKNISHFVEYKKKLFFFCGRILKKKVCDINNNDFFLNKDLAAKQLFEISSFAILYWIIFSFIKIL